MKSYLVWLSSDGRLAVSTTVCVEGPDNVVEAMSLVDPVGPFPPGLLYRVAVRADSLKEAMDRGATAAAHLADSLAWAHGTDIPDPQPIIAIEADSNSGKLEFGQFFQHLPLTTLPRRFFRDSVFGPFYTKWGTVPPGAYRDKIGRALRLFRRSLSDADPIDRFEDIWGSLETLNPLLQEKYSLPKKFLGGKCKTCGAPIEVAGLSSGIKQALVTLAGFPDEMWKQARGVRIDIAHGIANHDSLVGRIDAVFPVLRRALGAAILDLLEVTNVDLDDFCRQPLNPRVPAVALVSATLTGWQPPAMLGIEDLPFLEVKVIERVRTGDFSAPGTKAVTFDLSFTPRNLSGTMSDISPQLLVAKDPEDTNATLTQSGFSIERSDAQ